MSKEGEKYYQETYIPVRILKHKKMASEKKKTNWFIGFLKTSSCLLVAAFLILNQAAPFLAYEAHVVNVTARICSQSEIKSKGYWKTHPAVYAAYLPITIGDEPLFEDEVTQAFYDYDLSMWHKLRGQLLAMKFNIAHFGIGDYPIEEGKDLNQLVAKADTLLTQDPPAPDSVLEEMKDFLEYFNTLGHIRHCALRPPEPDRTHLIINKVYYDVGCRRGSDPTSEWIEIYNPTDQEVDITGWIVADNHEEDIIPQSDPIPAFGFAIIAAAASTFQYWNIPGDVVKIVLGSLIGDGLDNDGDRVILKMPDRTEVDAMSYGDDKSVFNPACPDVEKGHILGRVPIGFDTDSASDFKDFGLPYVQVLYPNGGNVLYVGQTYNLKWKATNPNGDNADLSIDIYYSGDSGSTWGLIVKDTENDGKYTWRLPLFLDDGYYVPSPRARIKVVATGPENFMISDWDLSDRDFCPPINVSLLTPEELSYLEETGLIDVIERAVDGEGDPTAEEELATEEPIVEEPIENTANTETPNAEETSAVEQNVGETSQENTIPESTDQTTGQTPEVEGQESEVEEETTEQEPAPEGEIVEQIEGTESDVSQEENVADNATNNETLTEPQAETEESQPVEPEKQDVVENQPLDNSHEQQPILESSGN